MVLDSSGNPIITGRMNVATRLDEMETVKFSNVDGDLIWESHEGGAARLDDRSLAVAVWTDDCPVSVGLLQNADGTADLMIIKYDADNGGVLWSRQEAGLVNDQSGDGWVEIDAAGDVFVCWKSWSSSTSYDIRVAKYLGTDGTPDWNITYNHLGSGADDPSCMILDPLGNPVVVGSSAGDYLMVKLAAADGGLLWSETYEGPQGWYDVAKDVTIGPAGNILVTGFSDGTGSMWDVATLALSTVDGSQQWVMRWDGADNATDEGLCLAANGLGYLFVAGYSYSNTTSMDQLVIAYDMHLENAVQETPRQVRLQAYPNPFNPRLNIAFAVHETGHVRVEVFDLLGRRHAMIQDGVLASGDHELNWDGRDVSGRQLASGTYVVRLATARTTSMQSVVLAR